MKVKRFSGKRETWWEQTVKGSGLRTASATPHIKRSTADRLLSQLLVRVNEVNNSDKFLCRVEEIIVFGNYLDETRMTLGDIDIAVKLERKEQNPEKHLKMNLDLADEDKRGYEIYNSRISYGWYKV